MATAKKAAASDLRQRILEEIHMCLSDLSERIKVHVDALENLLPALETDQDKKLSNSGRLVTRSSILSRSASNASSSSQNAKLLSGPKLRKSLKSTTTENAKQSNVARQKSTARLANANASHSCSYKLDETGVSATAENTKELHPASDKPGDPASCVFADSGRQATTQIQKKRFKKCAKTQGTDNLSPPDGAGSKENTVCLGTRIVGKPLLNETVVELLPTGGDGSSAMELCEGSAIVSASSSQPQSPQKQNRANVSFASSSMTLFSSAKSSVLQNLKSKYSCTTPSAQSISFKGADVNSSMGNRSTSQSDPIVVASCPEDLHDEVWEYCKAFHFAKAFGMRGDMVDTLVGDDWFPKWEAKVVMTAVTKARSMNAEYVKIVCIQGGSHCDKEMADQARLKKAIKQEYGADHFRVQMEWIEMQDFREKYCKVTESRMLIFFSYRLTNAFDAVMNLKMGLEELLPNAEYFCDVSQTDSLEESLLKVARCSHFLLFLTTGVMSSKLVNEQIKEALRREKEIILVTEAQAKFGAPDIGLLASECSEEMRRVLQTNIAIPWPRKRELQEVSLDRIVTALSKVADAKNMDRATSPAASNPRSFTVGLYGVDGGSMFDNMFLRFCSFSGVPLGDSSNLARIWKRVHQLIGLLAFGSLFTSSYYTKGPAFRSYLDNLLIPSAWLAVTLHELAYQKVWSRPDVHELIHNNARNRHTANELRKFTRMGAKGGIVLTLVLTALVHVLYTQSFFRSCYMDDAGGGGMAILVQGVMFIVFVVPMSAKVVALWLIQLVEWQIYISSASDAFCQLHGQIAELGVQKILEHGLVVHVSDKNFVRFQIAFMECWQTIRRTQDALRFSNAFLVLWWIVLSCMQVFNTVKLLKEGRPHNSIIGIDSDMWHLSLRTLCVFGLDIHLLKQFLTGHHARQRLKRWATHMVYTNPASRTAIVNLLDQLNFYGDLLPHVRFSSSLLPYIMCLIFIRVIMWSIEFYILDL